MRSCLCRLMRWWRRNGKQERSWKRGWRFWKGGIRRRGRGWRDLRARCKGLRGSGACWRREVECEQRAGNISTIRRSGRRLVRKGMKIYVKCRIAGARFRGRRAKGPSYSDAPEETGLSNYYPSQFRHQPPSAPTSLPTLALEIPDFELWITELWNDFLIEPTPYLVASAIIYFGFVLLLTQYYVAIWQLLCFLFQFVPWDDELASGYR